MDSRADIFVKKLMQFIPNAALVKSTFFTMNAALVKNNFLTTHRYLRSGKTISISINININITLA